MKVTAPSYKILSRQTFGVLLNEKYEGISNIYKTKIQDASSYCLTTDIWTEPFNTKSFLGITVHFLQNYKLMSLNIGVFELDQRHTGDYIAEKLKIINKEWNIENKKITAIITDGAANMKLAVDLIVVDKQKRIHCFAHQINLVVKRAIQGDEKLNEIINKVKELVTWFKQRYVASDELCRAQKGEEEHSAKKLKQGVASCWNSTFYMLQRFLELREHVNSIVNKFDSAPVMLTGKEMK